MQLQCRQQGSVAIVSDGTKEVALRRTFGKEMVEAHGIVASQEDWFFRIIPMIQVQQRQKELQETGAA